MATITFYEKPGCANNTRQKKLLMAAAHHVIAKSILIEAWTEQSLRPFFGSLPVKDWFNYSAPNIKYGEIDPNAQSEDQALALMLNNPLLIRRPLMHIDDVFIAGFDQELLDHWIGLKTFDTTTDLESCQKTHLKSECNHE